MGLSSSFRASKIAVHDKGIERVYWLEISPVEAAPFGFSTQRITTYNLNNPNGLIDVESMYEISDNLNAGTGTFV